MYCISCYGEIERKEKLPTCIICKEKIETWQEFREIARDKKVHWKCLRERKDEIRQIVANEERKEERIEREGGTIMGKVMNKIISILP